MLFQAESRHLLHKKQAPNFLWGAVFIFSPKIGLKSTKNVRFCILYRPMRGARAPPDYATARSLRLLHSLEMQLTNRILIFFSGGIWR